jgi:low temperature requirement protein LtrA
MGRHATPSRHSHRPEHVPERFGLFTLIVLGELVVAVGIGAADAVWSRQAVAVAIAVVFVGAGLWWLYFDGLEEHPYLWWIAEARAKAKKRVC